MTRAHLLDTRFGSQWPDLSTREAVQTLEATPLRERLAALSTYEALRVGATHNPHAPAIHLLPTASHEDTPITLTHARFFAGVTQVATALPTLGVLPGDPLSFPLPPHRPAFMPPYGA